MMKKRINVFLLVVIIISSLNCSYLFLSSDLSSDISYSNAKNNVKTNGISIGYAHTIIDESFFSLYAGLSYTLSPLIFENNDIYSSESDIDLCGDIINPINTEINIGHVFLKPEYKVTSKINVWLSLGINLLDIDYLQLEHPYELWQENCPNCDDDNPDNDVFTWVLEDECDSCVDQFSNVNAFGGMGIGLGLDYTITDKMHISLGKYTNSSKNIDGYDVSVFEYSAFDLKASRWVLGVKYNL